MKSQMDQLQNQTGAAVPSPQVAYDLATLKRQFDTYVLCCARLLLLPFRLCLCGVGLIPVQSHHTTGCRRLCSRWVSNVREACVVPVSLPSAARSPVLPLLLLKSKTNKPCGSHLFLRRSRVEKRFQKWRAKYREAKHSGDQQAKETQSKVEIKRTYGGWNRTGYADMQQRQARNEKTEGQKKKR
jgi:hypothetical protein